MASSILSIEFTDAERIAVIVTGIIGTISTIAVSTLLLHLFTVSFVSGRGGANKDERIFLRMQLGAFVVCLLCSDLIQGLSGIIQLVWVSRRGVNAGPLCTAQAAMLLFGDNGTAFWNAVVAIHTFWTVVLGKRMSTVAVVLLIATGWTTCVILTMIGPLAVQTEESGPFYAVAGAWCFVTTEYKYARIYLHYLPMLLSAFIITVLYLLVALVLFGVLVVDGSRWRLKAPTRHSSNIVRDFIGQFSWGRLARPGQILTHSTSFNSHGLKSATFSRIPGSIRMGGLPQKEGDAKAGLDAPEGTSTVVTVQTVDILPRPDTGSTVKSEDSLERGRKNAGKTAGNRDFKPDHKRAAHQVSGRTVQLRVLAVKMLWYPIVYLILIMPIAVSRVDSNLQINLLVMLGFMCLLWLMGTANTIIYICTRRLGPTPWSGRSLSLSRSRSKGGQTQEGPTTSRGVAPVQIYIDRHTHRATDDQLVETGREKPRSSSVTGADFPVIASLPSVARTDSKENSLRDYRESKVGFDFGHGPRHHVIRQSSLSGPPINAHTLPSQHTQQRQEPSTNAYTLPRQPVQRVENEQPSYREPHPYSRAPSLATNVPSRIYDIHTSFTPYQYEDDDDSLRTQSPTHSRQGSGSGSRGAGIGF